MFFVFVSAYFLQEVFKDNLSVGFEPLMNIRIVDLAAFIQIHGQSAMSRVIGFSPDRTLASLFYTSAKNTKLFIVEVCDCFWLFAMNIFDSSKDSISIVWVKHNLTKWDDFHLNAFKQHYNQDFKQHYSQEKPRVYLQPQSIQLRNFAGHYAHLPLESISWRFLFNTSGLDRRSEVSPWKFSGCQITSVVGVVPKMVWGRRLWFLSTGVPPKKNHYVYYIFHYFVTIP